MAEHKEYSMFEAIAAEILKMKDEIERISGGELEKTITCGELQKILNNARHSVRLLKKITIKKVDSPWPCLNLNHFLADATFIEAVKTVMQNPDYPYITFTASND